MVGGGGVSRRKLAKGYRFRFHGSWHGQKYQSNWIYKSESEALKARSDFLIEQEIASSKATNLFELVKRRLSELELKRTPKYARENERYLERLKDALGDIPVYRVTKGDIVRVLNQYAVELTQSGKQLYGVNAMLRAVKAFFGYCVSTEGIEMVNPAVGVGMFRVEKKLKHIPDDMDIVNVKSLLAPHQADLVDFCYQTACRVNEALSLTVKDISWSKGLITLWTRKSRGGNLVYRYVPLPTVLKDMKRLKRIPESGRVFHQWAKGSQPRFLTINIDRWNEKNGHYGKITPFGFHNLRHKRASEWASDNMSLIEIKTRLGHSSISTTQIYLQMLGQFKYSEADEFYEF